MRLSKVGWLVILSVCVVFLLLVFLVPRRKQEQKLPDGSVVVLEKVYYGKPEPFEYGGLMERLKRKLPQAWANRLFKSAKRWGGSSSWYNNTSIHTNEDALYIYITRHDPTTGDAESVDIRSAQLVDEHGCIFGDTQAGGQDDGRLIRTRSPGMGMVSSVNWYRFEAFPRHERKFRLQLIDMRQGWQKPQLYEFTVRNPALETAPRKDWVTEAFPITKKQGGASFILTGVKMETNQNYGMFNPSIRSPSRLEPNFQFVEDGLPSTNWQALDFELYDSSGDFTDSQWHDGIALCPKEPAWKLRARFFGSEKSHYASNSIWTLRGLSIPGAGKFTNLNSSQDMGGVFVEAKALAGPGEFKYSNDDVIMQSSPSKEPLAENSMDWGNGRTPYRTLRGKTPHLLVQIGELSDDQRMTIRATDEQGREFYGYEWTHWSTDQFKKGNPAEVHYLDRAYGRLTPIVVAFNLPPDAKTIDVTFCIHTCCIPEFIFKPPPMENPPASGKSAK